MSDHDNTPPEMQRLAPFELSLRRATFDELRARITQG
jgi:hypothetical protein